VQMTTQTTADDRPEPGIATDDELRDAVEALRAALSDEPGFEKLLAERFHGPSPHDSETIDVFVTDGDDFTKTHIINAALASDAPVTLRSIEQGSRKVSFYPTNQAA